MLLQNSSPAELYSGTFSMQAKPNYSIAAFRRTLCCKAVISWCLSSHQMVLSLKEKEFFIDNLLVRIHLIIEMILVDRPCAMQG